MATTASKLGEYLERHLLNSDNMNSTTKTALAFLNVATNGTAEASKFLTTDSNINQGIAKVTAWHLGTSGSETQINATAAEINQGADMSLKGEILETGETMTAADNGKTFFLSHATEFAVTLPALSTVVKGWHCKFIVGLTPSGADYTITEKASADTDKVVCNGITESETDTNDDGEYSAGATLLTFDATGGCVLGDWVEFHTNGIFWYVRGNAVSDGGIVIS